MKGLGRIFLGGLGGRIFAALTAAVLIAIAVTGSIAWLVAARAMDTTLAEVDASWLGGIVRETMSTVERPLLRDLERLLPPQAGAEASPAESLQRAIGQLPDPATLVVAIRRPRQPPAIVHPAAGDPLRALLSERADLFEAPPRRLLLKLGDRLLHPFPATAVRTLETRLGLKPETLFLARILPPEELARLAPREQGGIVMRFHDQGRSIVQLEWERFGQPPVVGEGPGEIPGEVIRSEIEDGSELDRFFVGSMLLRDVARTRGGMMRVENHQGRPYRMHYRIARDRPGGAWGGISVGYPDAGSGVWREEILAEAAVLILIGLTLLAIVALLIARRVSAQISRPVLEVRDALSTIAGGDYSVRVESDRRDEIGELQRLLNYTAGELRKREAMKELFGKYLSKQVAERILADDTEAGLAGIRKEISVLFADVRGFTSYSEQHDPEQVMRTLNEYFEVMVDVIAGNEGVLDKYIGDGLMVVFGAPVLQPDHAWRAVRTAIEMQAALRALNQRRAQRGDDPINIGIGVNTGPAISGNLGSIKRMEFTVIGDTVNLAARLESRAEKGQILIGAETFTRVGDRIDAEALGPIQVKGKRESVNVWRVSGVKP